MDRTDITIACCNWTSVTAGPVSVSKIPPEESQSASSSDFLAIRSIQKLDSIAMTSADMNHLLRDAEDIENVQWTEKFRLRLVEERPRMMASSGSKIRYAGMVDQVEESQLFLRVPTRHDGISLSCPHS